MTMTKKSLLAAFIISLLAGCASQEQQSQGSDAGADSGVTTGTAADGSLSASDAAANAATVFYFDFDQAVLKQESREALMVHAEDLKANPRSIQILGHCDERGTREYNMALGERRGKAVSDFLVLQGVDSSLVEVVSYGEEQPVATCHDESCWSQNRRAELK
ncbi:MAG: peptidoglycan-associated lipoprotein Pal [Cellvibrionaceae bacterium]